MVCPPHIGISKHRLLTIAPQGPKGADFEIRQIVSHLPGKERNESQLAIRVRKESRSDIGDQLPWNGSGSQLEKNPNREWPLKRQHKSAPSDSRIHTHRPEPESLDVGLADSSNRASSCYIHYAQPSAQQSRLLQYYATDANQLHQCRTTRVGLSLRRYIQQWLGNIVCICVPGVFGTH